MDINATRQSVRWTTSSVAIRKPPVASPVRGALESAQEEAVEQTFRRSFRRCVAVGQSHAVRPPAYVLPGLSATAGPGWGGAGARPRAFSIRAKVESACATTWSML